MTFEELMKRAEKYFYAAWIEEATPEELLKAIEKEEAAWRELYA